ncbi:MAG: cyclodeaminase/cyclohydrolase family protein [Acidimicrobiia bacterium]
MDRTSFGEESLSRFLELVASDQPTPSGGSVAAGSAAATTVALAAALVAMVGRLSGKQLDEAPAIVAGAESLLRRALALADEDATAYGEVRAAYARPKEADPDGRRRQIRQAFERATEVPLEITHLASETAAAASRLLQDGNPNLEGDAVTAVLLARAAAQAAATLVELNVSLGQLEGDWLDRSAAYLASAGVALPGPSTGGSRPRPGAGPP